VIIVTPWQYADLHLLKILMNLTRFCARKSSMMGLWIRTPETAFVGRQYGDVPRNEPEITNDLEFEIHCDAAGF
jgi:hypothetical protein